MLLGNFLVYVDLVFTLLEDPGVFPRLQAQKILVVDSSRASFILFFFEFDSRREQTSTVQALPYVPKRKDILFTSTTSMPTQFFARPRCHGKNVKRKKVPPRFELGLRESEPRVMTTYTMGP